MKQVNKTSCPHLTTAQHCQVVRDLSGHDWQPHPLACRDCINQPDPQQVNIVTVGMSIAARSANTQLITDLTPLLHPSNLTLQTSTGPGTELKKLLSWFSLPTADCQCETHAQIMNIWGPAKCREELETIIEWVVEEAEQQNYPSGPITRLAIKAIVKQAIRNAEQRKPP